MVRSYKSFFSLSNLINSYITVVEEHNKLVIVNHYFGDFISSTNTPWHFRIVWFFITTPLFVVVFFIFGFILLLIQIINGLMKINSTKDDLWKSRDQMFDFYLFILLIIMLMLTIKFNTSQFGGWRHLYFLYPVVIFLSLLGLEFFINLFKNSKFKIFIFLLIGLNLSYIFNWIYVNHPHQQVYFNFASKKYVISKFDLDYWGLSNIHSLKHIVERENKFPIKVGTVSFSSVEASIFMLDENTKKNILVVYELDEADFLIDNYKRRIRKNFKIDENEFEKYFEIIVDGIPINTVYKKIN